MSVGSSCREVKMERIDHIFPQFGPLSAESVRELTRKLQEDERLRKKAIKAIREDTYSFIEEAFELTALQRGNLRHFVDEETVEAVGRAYILVLSHGGEVDFEDVWPDRAAGTIPRTLTVEMDFSFGSGGDSKNTLKIRLIHSGNAPAP